MATNFGTVTLSCPICGEPIDVPIIAKPHIREPTDGEFTGTLTCDHRPMLDHLATHDHPDGPATPGPLLDVSGIRTGTP